MLFGFAHDAAVAIVACLIAGASWTIVLSILYVSAQVALPDWVRGRGLAIFLTVIFGATTVGSAVWGQLAGMEGLAIAHFVAAAGVVIAIPLTWGWKLQTGADLDLTPSMHWRAPVLAQKIENNQGPVLVTVQYRVDAEKRAEFLSALTEVGHERKRDGAFAWGVFEDTADTGRFVEIVPDRILARTHACARTRDHRRPNDRGPCPSIAWRRAGGHVPDRLSARPPIAQEAGAGRALIENGGGASNFRSEPLTSSSRGKAAARQPMTPLCGAIRYFSPVARLA